MTDNITITNVDTGSVVLEGGEHRDDLVTFAGADTYPAGTILARDSVSKKLIAFVKGGSTNENGIPKAVLTQELVATGAGDLPARPLIRGIVNKTRLIIDADGDDSNVDSDVLDQLRDFSITALNVQQLAELDNQ